MLNLAFVLLLALSLAALYAWAFRTLPGERWQFLASAPVSKQAEGGWAAVNFTYYGFFSALAYALSVALFIVLMGSLDIPLAASLAVVAAVLALCVPASNLLVRIVEGKRYGFTVGGASFVGLLTAPVAVWAVDRYLGPMLDFHLPLAPGLAAMSVCYVLGEGVGRLACISFGCCYGKPVAETTGWTRVLGERFSFRFEGPARKIAFASGLDRQAVLPVQALTAVLFAAVSVFSVWLFLEERFLLALPVALAVSQIWRTYSETLRADWRGGGSVSAYQWMAVVALLVALASPWLVPPAPAAKPDLISGFTVLWTPEALIFLQILWAILFFYTGRSTQTTARLDFSVRTDRI